MISDKEMYQTYIVLTSAIRSWQNLNRWGYLLSHKLDCLFTYVPSVI